MGGGDEDGGIGEMVGEELSDAAVFEDRFMSGGGGCGVGVEAKIVGVGVGNSWGWGGDAGRPIRGCVKRTVKPCDIRVFEPVQSFWCNSAESVATLPPCAPTSILESDTVRNRVLLAGHIAPRSPDVLLFPFVREIVHLGARKSSNGRVVGNGVHCDRDEENR